MAITIDLGEASDIHPRNKQDVGHRLARLALNRTYGKPYVSCGPLMKSARIENGSVRITFDHVADGLATKGGPLKHFAVAGPDRKFVWGNARIDDSSVVVHHSSIKEPVEVRYAWSDNPVSANLDNSEGLPAAPFRVRP